MSCDAASATTVIAAVRRSGKWARDARSRGDLTEIESKTRTQRRRVEKPGAVRVGLLLLASFGRLLLRRRFLGNLLGGFLRLGWCGFLFRGHKKGVGWFPESTLGARGGAENCREDEAGPARASGAGVHAEGDAPADPLTWPRLSWRPSFSPGLFWQRFSWRVFWLVFSWGKIPRNREAEKRKRVLAGGRKNR